jgi:sec-independent protein translocase protein TatA
MLAGGPFGLGPLEIGIILIVLVLIFGVSKIADLGGALGKSVREFRKAVKDDEAPSASTNHSANSSVAAPPPEATIGRFCSNCGAQIEGESKFCAKCGAPVQAAVS